MRCGCCGGGPSPPLSWQPSGGAPPAVLPQGQFRVWSKSPVRPTCIYACRGIINLLSLEIDLKQPWHITILKPLHFE